MKLKYKLFAIDFDDTIVYSDFPNILGLRPHAKRVMEKIKEHGGEIIVWTARSDLKPVKDFLDFSMIPYDGINEDFEEVLQEYEGQSRKIFADVYIDDRNLETRLNGGIDWLKIEKMIFEFPEYEVVLTDKDGNELGRSLMRLDIDDLRRKGIIENG